MSTALSLFGLNTASATVSTSKQAVEALASGGVQANFALTIAKRTGWHELQTVAASPGANLAATGSGNLAGIAAQVHGFMDDGVTLEGYQLAAGTTASFTVRVLASATTISGRIAVRLWKYSASAATYSAIGSAQEASASAFTTSLANRTVPGIVLGSAVTFDVGDKLYVEVLVDVTANTANSNTSSISLAVGGTTGGSTCVFPTTGYDPQSAPSAPSTPSLRVSDDSHIVVSWSSTSHATSYNVKRDGRTVATGVVATTGATQYYGDSGLVTGSVHTYTVSATNPGGTSADSAEASAAAGIPANTGTNIFAASATTPAGDRTFDALATWNASTWGTRDAGFTETLDSSTPIEGTKSLQITQTAALGASVNADPVQSQGGNTPAVAGTSYSFRFEAKAVNAAAFGGQITGYLEWQTGAGAVISSTDLTTPATLGGGVFVVSVFNVAAPATTAQVRLVLRFTGPMAAGAAVDVDRISMHTVANVGYPGAGIAPYSLPFSPPRTRRVLMRS